MTHLVRQNPRVRRPWRLIIVAGLLVAVGLALVLLSNDDVTGYSFGAGDGDVDGYSSETFMTFDNAWLVTRQAAMGYGLVWLGSVLAAGLVGVRVAARRSSSPD
jgi:hypothetical protein